MLGKNTSIIGAGAWGTAMAIHLSGCGKEVTIWAREPETVENIALGENAAFLPSVKIPSNIIATNNLEKALSQSKTIFLAVPVQYLRCVLTQFPVGLDFSKYIFANLAKGFEVGSGMMPSQIVRDVLGKEIAVVTLSGPSFAFEVACGKPTVLVSAGKTENALAVQKIVASPSLRVYSSDDLIGVELSGGLKNVLALAAGMADGLGLGENGRAALIVRGLAEMHRLTTAMGARFETAFGIAGLGDLVLTCTGGLSRNHKLGALLGKGMKAEEVLSSVNWVAEGFYTAPVALDLANKIGVELPITEQVTLVLSGKTTPLEAVHTLMTRTLKSEFYRNQ